MLNALARTNFNKICINGLNQRINVRSSSGATNTEVSEDSSSDLRISRNKSGLLNQHRNILHNTRPYSEPNSWIHLTEKYQRKVYGRFGSESGVSPSICFDRKPNVRLEEYNKLVEPDTIQTMVNKHKLQEEQKKQAILKREEEIHKKLQKLDQWKQDLNAKILKKEADAKAAKEKKDRLIEEVRRHFGYKVDPKDERFKEALEQKEKEDKKKQKEEKRKAREQKLMSKLTANTAT